MLTSISGSTSCSARRNSVQYAVSCPRPNATKSQAAFSGRCFLIDTDILGSSLEYQRTELADHRDRIHLLPEQVRGIQLDTDVGGAGQLNQLVDVSGIEHQVLRVQLQRHFDVEVACQLVR